MKLKKAILLTLVATCSVIASQETDQDDPPLFMFEIPDGGPSCSVIVSQETDKGSHAVPLGPMPVASGREQSRPQVYHTAVFVLEDHSVLKLSRNGLTFINHDGVAYGPTKRSFPISSTNRPSRSGTQTINQVCIHWEMNTTELLHKLELIHPVIVADYGAYTLNPTS